MTFYNLRAWSALVGNVHVPALFHKGILLASQNKQALQIRVKTLKSVGSKLDFLKTLYSRLSLSRNQRDPLKHIEISVPRHIRFVVLRKKQFEQPSLTNDYVI